MTGAVAQSALRYPCPMETPPDSPPTPDRLPNPRRTIAAAVREQLDVPWSRAKTLCSEGRVSLNGERCVDPAMRIEVDAVVVVDPHAPKLRTFPLDDSAIVHADRDIVIIDKPAGMLSVTDETGTNETIADYARTLLRRMKRGVDVPLGVVHRLDRDTSGLMVFTRSADAKRRLAERFRMHDIERTYIAIVNGTLYDLKRIESDIMIDRGDGLRGSSDESQSGAGRRSVTFVQPLVELNGATLVECRLETGRQHQIRIHLSEIGHPLVGEKVYKRDYRRRMIKAPRTMLHARTLGFEHPRSREAMLFESEPPRDFAELLESLRPL